MTVTGPETIHASAVRVGGDGVLIRGASGSGKSALVLQLVFRHPAAVLIADDRVALAAEGGLLVASPPPALAGKLEVRGQGIVDQPHVSPAAIRLVVDLAPAAECPRMPEENDRFTELCGLRLPRLMLPIGCIDAVERVQVALARAMPPGSG
ncbi:MAG: HPr kinase/phosphatase C-terminal domain-containing protein [Bauldia sp.]|nr:HPr kinase/phosphatase C-terminal domain-containing protein [Bauldia sp.]